MHRLDAEKLERLRKALGDKGPGALVEVTAGDLAAVCALVPDGQGGDDAETVRAFAKGAAAVKPAQKAAVQAEQLRRVLEQAELADARAQAAARDEAEQAARDDAEQAAAEREEDEG